MKKHRDVRGASRCCDAHQIQVFLTPLCFCSLFMEGGRRQTHIHCNVGLFWCGDLIGNMDNDSRVFRGHSEWSLMCT